MIQRIGDVVLGPDVLVLANATPGFEEAVPMQQFGVLKEVLAVAGA